MTDQEINHLIAIEINDWTHDEGIYYHDATGFTCYLADYCNSIGHALDLAKAHSIGLKPSAEGWIAYKLSDETVTNTDPLASKAICLCLLSSLDVNQAGNS